jgi:ABC-type antimicrobial peptide transport system permease subunit
LTSLVGLFTVLALILAVVGVYGALSYFVAQRTHELGVRMALGAGRGQLLLWVLGRGARLALWGVALGTAGALAASQVTRRFLYGLRPADPWFVGGVAVVLLVTALSAALIPARRATKVEPALALRAE